MTDAVPGAGMDPWACLVLGPALWLCVRNTSRASNQPIPKHRFDRQVLRNCSFLRATYVARAVLAVLVLTYLQLSAAPGELHAGQVTGLAMSYCVVAVVLWSMVVTLTPYYGSMAKYNQYLPMVMFTILTSYFSFAQSLGVVIGVNGVDRVLAYNLYWLLEDVPLSSYYPIIASWTVVHLAHHLRHDTALWSSPASIVAVPLTYVLLGGVLPLFSHAVVRFTIKPIRMLDLPFRLVCITSSLLSTADLMMRVRFVSERVQNLATAGSIPARLLVYLQPFKPPDSTTFVYGLSPFLTSSVTLVLILGLLLSCVVIALRLEPSDNPDANDPHRDAFATVKYLSKIRACRPILAFLRSLTEDRCLALCGVLTLGAFQFILVSSLLLRLCLGRTSAQDVHTAPLLLLHILLAFLLQLAGLLFVLSPQVDGLDQQQVVHKQQGARQQRGKLVVEGGMDEVEDEQPKGLWTTTINSAGKGQSTRLYREIDTGKLSRDTYTTMKGMHRSGPQGTWSHSQSFDSTNSDMVARMEALANYKAFMAGLDAQPDDYSVDEFITGTASALRNMFPNVHHASLCLLNHGKSSVNMFTFIGDGSRKAPRMDVKIAASTLIYHVLQGCQPVFIDNITNFQGPFSDVQFMRFVLGLKSVACLPLVSVTNVILGVLRLGFQEPSDWSEQEKNIAKQTALIVSSSSNMGGHEVQRGGWAGGMEPLIEEGSRRHNRSVLKVSSQDFIHSPNASGSHLVGPGGMQYGQYGYPHDSGGGSSNGVRRSSTMQPMHNGSHIGPIDSSGSSGIQMARAKNSTGGPFMGHLDPSVLSPPSHSGYLRRGATVGSDGMPAGARGWGLDGMMMFGEAGGSQASVGARSRGVQGVQGNGMPADSERLMHSASSNSARGGRGRGPGSEGGRGGAGGRPHSGAASAKEDDLKLLEVIGRGGFGSVYKAYWKGQLVAVKVLEHGDDFIGCAENTAGDQHRKLDLSSRRAALLEGAMTSTISHPNVVTTYDYRVVHLEPRAPGLAASRISQETHIVMEWCDHGSLQDAMEQGVFKLPAAATTAATGVQGGGVDLELLCMTLAEVSSAMEYLHTHRVTHRDLKPKNVLLRTSSKDRTGFRAKVSDFGLSQVLPDGNRTQVSKNYSGTVTHMPPELIEDGKVYPQGDVYAFGIMMWEVFTGNTPYAHMAHPQIMVAVVTHNLRPRFPETAPEWYKKLAHQCWHKDPRSRPSFSEVTSQLLSQVKDPAWQAVCAEPTSITPPAAPAP